MRLREADIFHFIYQSAFIAAIPLILTESLFLINLINKSFITPGASAKLFDAILVQKGYSELVGKGRSITKSGKGVQILGKSLLRDVGGKFSTVRFRLSSLDLAGERRV